MAAIGDHARVRSTSDGDEDDDEVQVDLGEIGRSDARLRCAGSLRATCGCATLVARTYSSLALGQGMLSPLRLAQSLCGVPLSLKTWDYP